MDRVSIVDDIQIGDFDDARRGGLTTQVSSAGDGVNCRQAMEEGWVIVDSDIGCRLEKIIQVTTLVDDEHCWRLVAQRASYGSALHVRAIAFMRENSDEGLEFESFCVFLDRAPA